MMKIDNRLQKLRQSLAEKEIEAILISQPENRYYLSGFDGSAGFLLVTPEKAVLATDFRYIEQAKRQTTEYEIFQISNDIAGWFPELVTGLKLKRLGFEARHITFALYHKFSYVLEEMEYQLGMLPLDSVVESLRAIKEPEEIELIARAVEISDSAFEHIEGKIAAGISEKEVAWEIEKFMREQGSQTIPFDIVVASGPNSALPHAKPSSSTINSGEPVLLDIGANIEGYSSNLSRTICLGSPDDTFNKVYQAVLKAQSEAIAQIEENMTGEQADSLARTVIEQTGYGDAFGHGLGHGIGLAPHETPRLGPNSTDELTSGMVFTIEPGIYLPGWGGVRIEDTAMMENGKIRVFSQARKVGVKHDKW
ncbi:MAG: aminopeptidase P family protein [Dehalococcoidia bacterium]|nr:MAG: aminopeptidase P family protein [Dehalococcoidia bacterium]